MHPSLNVAQMFPRISLFFKCLLKFQIVHLAFFWSYLSSRFIWFYICSDQIKLEENTRPCNHVEKCFVIIDMLSIQCSICATVKQTLKVVMVCFFSRFSCAQMCSTLRNHFPIQFQKNRVKFCELNYYPCIVN